MQARFQELYINTTASEQRLLDFEICGIKSPYDVQSNPIRPPRVTILLSARQDREDLSKGSAGSDRTKKPGSKPRVDAVGDPLDYKSAMMLDPANWSIAIRNELRAYEINKTFKIYSLLLNKTAISCK